MQFTACQHGHVYMHGGRRLSQQLDLKQIHNVLQWLTLNVCVYNNTEPSLSDFLCKHTKHFMVADGDESLLSPWNRFHFHV